MADINDGEILDETIRSLRERIQLAQADKDDALWLKLNDRLLKALAMKAKQRGKRKGKGFDLSK